MLKALIYIVAIWFFIRIIRRVASVWLMGSDNRKFKGNQQSKSNGLDSIEDAHFTEIDETKQ